MLEKRTRQAARAGEELTRHDITQFVTRTRSLLQVNGLQKEPEALLKQSIDEALAVWNEALRKMPRRIRKSIKSTRFALPESVYVIGRSCSRNWVTPLSSEDQSVKAAAR